MATKGKPALVEVEWEDACSKYEQYSLREAPEKCKLVVRLSAGYLVLKDKSRLILAHTFDRAMDDDELDGGADFTIIPRAWVQKITHLQPRSEQPADAADDA